MVECVNGDARDSGSGFILAHGGGDSGCGGGCGIYVYDHGCDNGGGDCESRDGRESSEGSEEVVTLVSGGDNGTYYGGDGDCRTGEGFKG